MEGPSGELAAGIGPESLGTIVLLVGLVGVGMTVLLLGGRRWSGSRRQGDLAPVPAVIASAEQTTAAAYRRAIPTEVSNVPRWRRASVLEGRSWTPPIGRPLPQTARRAQVFTEPLGESAIRLIVRYDRVELLDQPNEAFARTLTEVGTGDEVEVLEVSEPWARVVTPSAVTGWLPSMTIGGAPATAPVSADESPPPATSPRRASRKSRAPRPST